MNILSFKTVSIYKEGVAEAYGESVITRISSLLLLWIFVISSDISFISVVVVVVEDILLLLFSISKPVSLDIIGGHKFSFFNLISNSFKHRE